jgi:hypothetical protein
MHGTSRTGKYVLTWAILGEAVTLLVTCARYQQCDGPSRLAARRQGRLDPAVCASCQGK